MSKIYPNKKQDIYTIVNSDALIQNTSAYANELNGKLDSDNLPLRSLNADKFADPAVTDASTTKYFSENWEAETQQYWELGCTSLWLEQEQAVGTIWEPFTSHNLITDDWGKGWNDVRVIDGCDFFRFDLDTKEGMLNGAISIDFSHGANVVYSEPLYFLTGIDWWTQWGVFVNGVLVADSGKCMPQGQNIVLPFSIPVGNGQVYVEVKFKTTTTNALNVSGYTGDPTTNLDIWGISGWCRNTWR